MGDRKAARLLADAEAAPQTLRDAEEYVAVDYPLDAAHRGAVLEKTGVPEQARESYERACSQGDAHGADLLAALLVRQDAAAEAEVWYRKPADLGHAGAARVLAQNRATVDE